MYSNETFCKEGFFVFILYGIVQVFSPDRSGILFILHLFQDSEKSAV